MCMKPIEIEFIKTGTIKVASRVYSSQAPEVGESVRLDNDELGIVTVIARHWIVDDNPAALRCNIYYTPQGEPTQ